MALTCSRIWEIERTSIFLGSVICYWRSAGITHWEMLFAVYYKLILTRPSGTTNWFQKNHAMFLNEGLSLKKLGFDCLFRRTTHAHSILCLTAGKQAELELGGWLSACPYGPGLSQISCSQKMTDRSSRHCCQRKISAQYFRSCKLVKRLKH